MNKTYPCKDLNRLKYLQLETENLIASSYTKEPLSE